MASSDTASRDTASQDTASQDTASQDTASGAAASRLDVRSADGTRLAVWVDGYGPPLVLVHGSMSDHSAARLLVARLRDHLTTYALDRRGFGVSGDTPPYDLEREFEDVAAVVDAVAARTGSAVALYGHSYGASCAMGGAARTDRLSHLVLYEPSLGLPYPPGAIDEIERSVAAGDGDAALVAVYVGVVGLDPDQVEALRRSPDWPSHVATAPTVARESRAEEGWVYRPGQFDGVTVPTLLLRGSESPPPLREATRAAAAAIPGAAVRVLPGQAHRAHVEAPDLVAGAVREFVGG